MSIKDILRVIVPRFILKLSREKYSNTRKDPGKEGIYWTGNYKSWEDAEKDSTGYDAENILNRCKTAILKVKNGEAAYERDSVTFNKLEYSEDLLRIFKRIGSSNSSILSIIDFGGSLGSTYFQYRTLLTELKTIYWKIVEQAHFVDFGKESLEDDNLKFYFTIEDALQANKSNVLLLAGVVQCLQNPYDFIQKILKLKFDHILVDRTGFIENDATRLTIQSVPESIYSAIYPAWFFNEPEFVSLFSTEYIMEESFMSEVSTPVTLEDGRTGYWKSFYFKRRK